MSHRKATYCIEINNKWLLKQNIAVGAGGLVDCHTFQTLLLSLSSQNFLSHSPLSYNINYKGQKKGKVHYQTIRPETPISTCLEPSYSLKLKYIIQRFLPSGLSSRNHSGNSVRTIQKSEVEARWLGIKRRGATAETVGETERKTVRIWRGGWRNASPGEKGGGAWMTFLGQPLWMIIMCCRSPWKNVDTNATLKSR